MPYSDEGRKVDQVEQMFNHIAPVYDRLNLWLSLGLDRGWRKAAIKSLRPYKIKRLLDVATGTGDFALLAHKMLPAVTVVGADIAEGMMNIGREKVKKAGLTEQDIVFDRQDSIAFTYADNAFDAVTVAFGVRNFEDLDTSLSEMCRVLKPGGRLVILELSTPDHKPINRLFGLYSRLVIPTMGRLFSSDKAAYHYLPGSIRAFPQGETMKEVIRRAGFDQVQFRRMTLGTCTLYTAQKPKQ